MKLVVCERRDVSIATLRWGAPSLGRTRYFRRTGGNTFQSQRCDGARRAATTTAWQSLARTCFNRNAAMGRAEPQIGRLGIRDYYNVSIATLRWGAPSLRVNADLDGTIITFQSQRCDGARRAIRPIILKNESHERFQSQRCDGARRAFDRAICCPGSLSFQSQRCDGARRAKVKVLFGGHTDFVSIATLRWGAPSHK